MLTERTTAATIGLVTFLAAFIVVKGIIRVMAETHPDSRVATAVDELTS